MLLITQSVRVRVALLIAAAIVSMIALACALIVESHNRIAEFHLENAKTALKASLAMLEQEQSHVEKGEYDLELAQRRSLERLRTFRYNDGEGYVAIVRDDGFMTMHPVHEHLDQTNIWDLQDPTGDYIVREIINIGLTEGVGVNRYFFEHPITGQIDTKTSAVGRFAPWNWTLIVGVFGKSVDQAVSDMLQRAIVVVLSMSCLFLLLAIAIGRSLSEPITALTTAMTSIADGRLDTPIPFQDFANESGKMARGLAVFRDSGRQILELQAEKEQAQRILETERTNMTTRLRDQFGKVLEASSKGDFSQRVATDFSDTNLRALAQTLNRFVEKVDAGVSTVKQAMSAMANGRRLNQRTNGFEGAFADMMDDVAKTAEKLQRQADHLEHTSLHDSLTGLPNRRYFEHRIADVCSDDDGWHETALLHIDLDRFKQINDTHGHSAGDEILKHTARTLRCAARAQDFVARIGGDEFIVLCTQECSDQVVRHIANEIVASLGRPYAVNGIVARFGASVGVAVGSDNRAELLKNADLALYKAKESGRGQVHFYSKAIHSEFVRKKQTGDDILRALDNEEFVPYFQPQLDAKSRRVVGVEALARWNHPDRGLLAPGHFLSVAEDLNVISKIDRQIFHQAVESIRRVNSMGLGRIDKLSVNLSCHRLLDESLLSSIDEVGPVDHQLAFELVESIVFDEQGEYFINRISALKARGIEIEIDDFGSGRASITGLLKVAPDRLKIDRQLIAPIVDQESQRKLIAAILDIGQTLGIGIIAEGVESMEHARLLADMNCETLQGFAFARPLSEPALVEFLRDSAMPLAS